MIPFIIGAMTGGTSGVIFMKMCPKRTAEYIRADRTKMGHAVRITYTAGLLA